MTKQERPIKPRFTVVPGSADCLILAETMPVSATASSFILTDDKSAYRAITLKYCPLDHHQINVAIEGSGEDGKKYKAFCKKFEDCRYLQERH